MKRTKLPSPWGDPKWHCKFLSLRVGDVFRAVLQAGLVLGEPCPVTCEDLMMFERDNKVNRSKTKGMSRADTSKFFNYTTSRHVLWYVLIKKNQFLGRPRARLAWR